MTEKHARAFDLPGWPCPPRVRDIPNHENSWGWGQIRAETTESVLAVDELGYLWVNGDTVPGFRLPNETDANPGAIVFWSSDGIGLWVHPKSLQYLPSISRLDMRDDQWVRVAVVAPDLPGHVGKTS
jgi:hypothetical protein